jgi:CubicO group peptidase (beta-lactamase class C family)
LFGRGDHCVAFVERGEHLDRHLLRVRFLLKTPCTLEADMANAQAPRGKQSADLIGVVPFRLADDRRAAFEGYLSEAIPRFGVPGAAVAVIQDREVTYLRGFGVKELGGTQPVTPDTLFMIGSITKPMTTMLAAALVDDGRLNWDTRLIDVLPQFAAGDRTMTERLTVRDAFCNCTGVPGCDLERYFKTGRLSPEETLTALADIAPAASFGEQFIYNNLLVAAGGYAAGVAARGDEAGDVGFAYDAALQQRVLSPIGMKRSTFDPEAVRADGDYALPHAADLSGDLRPIPLEAERDVLLPVRPAGGLWSTAQEMARFVQTELAGGIAPSGTRVVSAANLAATWAPRVPVPNFYGGPPEMAASMSNYGLGWMSGEYRGVRVISHTGGTTGFTAQVAFLPAANLGIAVLSNASALPGALAFTFAVHFHLLELLFDQPAEMDAQLFALAQASAAGRPQLASHVDPAAVAPYLGRYTQPTLGEVRITWRGDRLVLDAGELATELRARATDGSNASVYLLHDPPLSFYSEAYGATVTFTGGVNEPRVTLTIPGNPTGPEQTYVFEPSRPTAQ